jgi:hypothetical protein
MEDEVAFVLLYFFQKKSSSLCNDELFDGNS